MKNALILGGASDIGFAIAEAFARNDYGVILCGRNKEVLERNVNDIRVKYGTEARHAYFDATDFASHKLFWDSFDKKPTVAVCVFGYLGDHDKALNDTGETLAILHTNFTGAVSILTIIAHHYAHAKAGSIIGISSVAGDRGRQSNFIYGAAKGGFTTYLQGLRNYLFHERVHVMTVIPGFVATKMTEHLDLNKRITATPEEVANAVFRGLRKKKNVIYVKWMWRYIMLIIKLIPEGIFKKMRM